MANVLLTAKRYSDRTIVDEVRCGPDGSIISLDYAAAIARGYIPGAEMFGSFGKRTASGAVTLQMLWPDGAFLCPPTAGVQLSIVSTSAQDGVGGTGIRTMDIHYLDDALIPQVETIVLNGTTPVLTVATNIRFVQCQHMLTFGTGKSAAGVITSSNGGNTYGQISTGEVRCTSAARMVPAGKKLMVNSMYASSVSGGSAETTVAFASTIFDGHDFTADSAFIPFAQGGFQDNGLSMTFNPPLSFTEGACVGMLYTQTSAATVTGGWFGWLENV